MSVIHCIVREKVRPEGAVTSCRSRKMVRAMWQCMIFRAFDYGNLASITTHACWSHPLQDGALLVITAGLL